ncbi:uncharacterized protein LOC113562888 [Ooceraea biroi]|uniref:uncharacterized protein LOC113562888 n=1 Tax=Ooceraea biroi TaxID=2015173 RepID=UPI0005BB1867|nr:uncharacterized protein LOC113562888 [Ooceraea biroi]
MDFFQVIRGKNVTNSNTEIAEYTAKPQLTRVQYDTMYKYGQNITTRYDDAANDIPRNQSLISQKRYTFADTESPDEEPYDYEKFKMEYDQQLEYNIKYGKVFNYTEKEELKESPKEALKRIIDLKRPKNCTKEELGHFGIKAIKCLIYDYQRTRNVAAVRKVLFRTWLVVRIWLLIYVCLAIPFWCHRGWCCCCFRCKFCFPRKRILFAKRYYTLNPPGTFVKSLKKPREDIVEYKTTEYEYNAHEVFEAAIRNI